MSIGCSVAIGMLGWLSVGGGEATPLPPQPWEKTPQAFGQEFPVLPASEYMLEPNLPQVLGLDAAIAASLRAVVAARKAEIDDVAALLTDTALDEPARTARLRAALDRAGFNLAFVQQEVRRALGAAGSRRLDQLRWQLAGPFGPLASEHAATLGIGEVQRQRIDQAIKECVEFRKKAALEYRSDVQRGLRKALEKIPGMLEPVLDETQRAHWRELCGAPFPPEARERLGYLLSEAGVRDLDDDRKYAANPWNWRVHVQELMRPMESAAVRRWLEMDDDQQRRFEAMEAARDEFEAMFPRLIDRTTQLEWKRLFWEVGMAACKHRYSDRAFKVLRPDQLKRFKALRFRIFGTGEMMNYYSSEFGISEEDRNIYYHRPRKGDRESMEQADIALLTPAQRAKWHEYWDMPAPPEVIFNAACAMIQARPREKHDSKPKAAPSK